MSPRQPAGHTSCLNLHPVVLQEGLKLFDAPASYALQSARTFPRGTSALTYTA
jgi:hypothetical protein